MMVPRMLRDPMDNAPRSEPGGEPVQVLLYCPDEDRWHTGVWVDGAWRLHTDLERILHPTHWLPVGVDVLVERGRSRDSTRREAG